jgi:ribosomal protein S18 acetylase RimI-like enzyme
MSNMQIRDYSEQDYQGVAEVWIKTGLGGHGRGDNREIVNQSIAMGGKLLVAEDPLKSKIVGTSWMTFDGRRIHLHHIGVLPEYRNQGCGTRLTRESLKFAREKGYQIKLEVETNNAKAIDLYTKLGFKRLGDYDIYIVRKPGELPL